LLAVALAACAGQAAREAVEPPVPAGDFVVFTPKDLATRADLYLARLDGSETVRLNSPLTPGGTVFLSAISPDRRRVAYVADQDTPGVFELHVARTDAAGPSRCPAPWSRA
jgi:Tol biopolymer transport system component